MKSNVRPSEVFLLAHRLFTFLDEWLFYALLYHLWHQSTIPKWLFWTVAGVGATMIVISYGKQWYMEAQRFHNPAGDADGITERGLCLGDREPGGGRVVDEKTPTGANTPPELP